MTGDPRPAPPTRASNPRGVARAGRGPGGNPRLDLGLGPLGRRLFAAFAVVALASVALLALAAAVAANHGISTARQSDRQAVAARVASAAGAAYSAAGGWGGANLNAAQAIAVGAGANLTVRDSGGHGVYSGSTSSMMGGSMPGMGPSMTAAVTGGPSAGAAVTADGGTVGSVQLYFSGAASAGSESISWPWVLAAASAALALALIVSWYVTRRVTRPITRVARTATAIAAGDRAARAEVSAPGELGELARAFDAMADDLSRAERTRRNLAADVAHELRTPLAALQAGLEELRDGYADPSTQRLAGLHDQSLRLTRIVGDLAELSEAESAALSLRAADVDVNAVVAGAVADRDAQLRAAGLSVRTLLHPEPLYVRGDADRLHQALGNLLSNAARYCAPGDSVTLATGPGPGGRVHIEVADTGPGIDQAELPRIFDRFFRGHSGHTVGGTGIGLAVVKELIAAHGGTIDAVSRQGEGTCFTLTLPLADPADAGRANGARVGSAPRS